MARYVERDKLTRVLSTILPRDPEWLRSTTGEHDAIERGREFMRQALGAS